MFSKIREYLHNKKERKIEKDVCRKYGFELFCPHCKKGINRYGGVFKEAEHKLMRVTCGQCGTVSIWNNSISSMWLFVSVDEKKIKEKN